MTTIADLAKRFQRIGEIDKLTAQIARPQIEALQRSYTTHGVDPSTGEAWAPKKDGGQALVNAGKAIAVRVGGQGMTLIIELSGPEVFHHYAKGKTTPRRGIIPRSDIPADMADVLKTSAEKAFQKLTR